MKKIMLASLILIGLMTGCESTTDSESEEDENSGLHSQGISCASCHSAGSEEPFTSGATVFTTLDAANSDESKYATGYTLRLLLANTGTTVNYRAGRGSGNSYTSASAGTINSYTAQVLNSSGRVVNSSATDSHDLTRLDCNRCHTATGKNGAPGRIMVGSGATAMPARVSFSGDVMPILEAKCKTCHGSGGNFTISTAAGTYSNITVNSFLDTATPSNSRLLKKSRGTIDHDGGSVIPTTSLEYQTIVQWITEGASSN